MKKIMIFYDGTCGLCHAFIRFVLFKLDLRQSFLFAPQTSTRFKILITQFSHLTFPDSLAVYNTKSNQLAFKTKAIILVLMCLKWPWKLLAFLLKCIPTKIADYFYDFLAKRRYIFFKKPKSNCPIIPANLKHFFVND